MEEHPLHGLGFTPRAPSLADLRPARLTATASQAEPQATTDRMVKGTRVRLADGSAGKIVYLDPNMRIARVRTDQGRSVTVRRKQLRPLNVKP